MFSIGGELGWLQVSAGRWKAAGRDKVEPELTPLSSQPLELQSTQQRRVGRLVECREL